jgi:hypothetical protein
MKFNYHLYRFGTIHLPHALSDSPLKPTNCIILLLVLFCTLDLFHNSKL